MFYSNIILMNPIFWKLYENFLYALLRKKQHHLDNTWKINQVPAPCGDPDIICYPYPKIAFSLKSTISWKNARKPLKITFLAYIFHERCHKSTFYDSGKQKRIAWNRLFLADIFQHILEQRNFL